MKSAEGRVEKLVKYGENSGDFREKNGKYKGKIEVKIEQKMGGNGKKNGLKMSGN